MNKLSNEVLHSNQTTNVLPKNVLVIMNPIAKKKKAENLVRFNTQKVNEMHFS